MTTRKIGAQGESFAAQILQKRGMEILLRNYYTPYGEIDLIVRDGGYIAFVEVKTRRAGSLVRPAEAVDRRQAKKDHPVGCILPDGASRRSTAKI